MNCGKALYKGSTCPRGKTCGGSPNAFRITGDSVEGETGGAGLASLLSVSGFSGSGVLAGASVEVSDGSFGESGVAGAEFLGD